MLVPAYFGANIRSSLHVLAAILAVVLPSMTSAAALELHRERAAATDLAVTGHLAGLREGETRYVRWADLWSLPTERLKLHAEFFSGEQEVTIVFLSDLWKALPCAADADTALAICGDGYASVFRAEVIADCRPFLVLEINGLGPEKWPPPELRFNPAPYVISVSATIAPAVAQLLDPGHKKPWDVTTLEFVNFSERFYGAYAGKWSALSARAAAGREIWINSCASCHPGPGRIFGGTKSGQPFPVLEALASCNADFFKLYVHDPRAANPAAKMEAHSHYNDTQLDELVAFVIAEQAK